MSAAITSEMLTAMIRARYAERRHAAKHVARTADVAVRTVENWLSGVCAPQAAQLARLLAHDDELRAQFNELLDRVRREAPDTTAFRARHAALSAAVDAAAGNAAVVRGHQVPGDGRAAAEPDRRWIETPTWSGWDRRRRSARGLAFPTAEFFGAIGT